MIVPKDCESPKRRRVLSACSRCKQRKKKCDGAFPSCGLCVKTSNQCVYENTKIQDQHVFVIEQTSKMSRLEAQAKEMMEEIRQLKSSLMETNFNEYNEQPDSNSSIIQPIVNLLQQPTSKQVYIGQSAVISKVQAIRKMLTNGQDPELHQDPFLQIRQPQLVEYPQYPTQEAEKIFINCYIRFSYNRYIFIEKSELMAIFDKIQLERTNWESFVAFICLANGCTIAQLSKIAMQPSPKYYFDKALKVLNQMTNLSPMQQIQACMLLALYLTYAYDYNDTFVMNVWELSGMAIRKMIQLGYHKRKLPRLENCIEVELQKRLFWSVYAFDKLLSLSLGRNSSFIDSEIDIPFPLSIVEVGTNAHSIFNLQTQQLNNPEFKLPVTSITYLVETCRIRQIEGKINILAYERATNQFSKEFDTINESLEAWLRNLPSRKEFNEGLTYEVVFEYLVLLYHRAKLFLLLPKLTLTPNLEGANKQEILLDTLKCAGGICKAFQVIHKHSIFGYSTFSLHTIFLAGVTLVYCVWSLSNPPTIKAHNDIRACSNLLYSFSERSTEAETYRILFENLVEKILYNNEVNEVKETVANELVVTDTFLDDNKFNFTFNDDFWRRLDFN